MDYQDGIHSVISTEGGDSREGEKQKQEIATKRFFPHFGKMQFEESMREFISTMDNGRESVDAQAFICFAVEGYEIRHRFESAWNETNKSCENVLGEVLSQMGMGGLSEATRQIQCYSSKSILKIKQLEEQFNAAVKDNDKNWDDCLRGRQWNIGERYNIANKKYGGYMRSFLCYLDQKDRIDFTNRYQKIASAYQIAYETNQQHFSFLKAKKQIQAIDLPEIREQASALAQYSNIYRNCIKELEQLNGDIKEKLAIKKEYWKYCCKLQMSNQKQKFLSVNNDYTKYVELASHILDEEEMIDFKNAYKKIPSTGPITFQRNCDQVWENLRLLEEIEDSDLPKIRQQASVLEQSLDTISNDIDKIEQLTNKIIKRRWEQRRANERQQLEQEM